MMKKSLLITIVLGYVAVASGCGSSPPVVRMVASLDVPAAQGTVKATSTDNNNTAIEVEVHHLAPPERVQPGATTYVVWARATGQDTYQNLGALRVDENLRGTLKTITPLRSFDVMITAEAGPTVMTPTSRRLLSASIERKSD
jgi:hypothetical protein